MPTWSRSSTARFHAASLPASLCAENASAIWAPTRYIGWRHANGSWKTIAISLPRPLRSSSGGSVSRSRPLNSTSPEITVRARLSRPMIARFETLLPEPDSPTMPRVSPRDSVNDTSETAWTMPSEVGKRTVRPRTSRRRSPLDDVIPAPACSCVSDSGVDERVKDVDDQVHQRDGECRQQHDAEHGREILRRRAVDRQVAEALEVEDGLGDH